MLRLVLLMYNAAALIVGVSSQDINCNRSGKQWERVVLNPGDSYTYSTSGETWSECTEEDMDKPGPAYGYRDWMKCHGKYELGPDCDGAIVSCQKFNTISSKDCVWGDFLAITDQKMNYKRFCQNKGPVNFKPIGDFKMRFISNGKKTGGGLCCTVECHSPQPVDCQLAEWTSWSACSQSCDGGSQERNRTIIKEASNGGSCSETQETKDCNSDPCPVNCKLTEWTDWTACSQTCGEGFQERFRTIITPASNGGNCSETEETKACNETVCPVCDGGWVSSPGLPGFCYLFLAEERTWEDSRKECIGRGGNLASIHSFEENKFVGVDIYITTATLSTPVFVWMGLNTVETVSGYNWIYSDGTEVDYTLWPSGRGTPSSGRCVSLFGVWFLDVGCESLYPAICKKGLMENEG